MAAAAIALVAAAVAVADVAVSRCKLQLSPAGAINNKRKSVNHCGNGQVQSSMEDEQEQQQQQHVDSDKQLAKTDEGFISCGGVVGVTGWFNCRAKRANQFTFASAVEAFCLWATNLQLKHCIK